MLFELNPYNTGHLGHQISAIQNCSKQCYFFPSSLYKLDKQNKTQKTQAQHPTK